MPSDAITSEADKALGVIHAENADNEDHLKPGADAVLSEDTGFAGFTKIQTLKYFWWPVLLCIMANLGVMNDGYQNLLPGNLISNRGFIRQFGDVHSADGEIALAASWVSLWGAMTPVGQVGGSITAGLCNDRFGRLSGMYLLTAFYIIATILEMTSHSPPQWAGAKFMFGFGQGLTISTVPVYVGELAPPAIRGTLLVLYGFLFAIGQLLAGVVLYVVEQQRPLDWRVAVYTEWAIHGFWILFGLIWLPESPWYYVRRGQDEKALKSLKRIYKGVKSFDPSHELKAIKHEIERQRSESAAVAGWADLSSWASLFKDPNRIRTSAAALAISTQMLAGAIVVFNYSAYFVQQAGIGEPFLASMIVTVVLLVGLMFSLISVEFLGRRTLMLAGGIGCTICNTVVGITGLLNKSPIVDRTALAFIFMWVFSYASSFAGVSWALVSECATPTLKPKTAAVSTIAYDIASLVFTVSVPFMLASAGTGARDWGTRSLFMFTITCGVATIGNFFLCPETKGRTQGELDEMYENKVPPRKFSKYVSQLETAGGKGRV